MIMAAAVLCVGGLGSSHFPVVKQFSPHQVEDVHETDIEPVMENETPSLMSVDAVKPAAGGLSRTIVQTGTVEAYESADLVARVSGYLKTIHVEIGDEVSAGQVLAEIDAPELIKDIERQ